MSERVARSPIDLAVCIGLVMCVLAIYGQTLGFDFVNYDDGLYVTDNERVMAGLSWGNVWWAFATERAMYFHPLTWLSHMLDCHLYGLRAWGHHLTSFAVHTLNSVLLYFVLKRMTGRVGASAFAAALFAAHPLHVESVAWIAERKDVLSTFFWVAAMGAYARYVRKPDWRGYALVSAMFVLGYMSKPMVVTLPCVLILLDWWPLNRIERNVSLNEIARRATRLFAEKLPLFALTGLMSALTMLMQVRGNNLEFGNRVPLAWRVANAVVVYVIYLVKTFWPLGLAMYYPHPITRPLWQVAGAAIVLLAITALCLHQWRRRPYLIVGWLWYLGTLVPVIELVQAGSFSHADRYTYIPSIGVFLMLSFGAAELAASWRLHTYGVRIAAIAVIVTLTGIAAKQGGYWRDSVTLNRHALEVTADNGVVRNNLAQVYGKLGRKADAKVQYERAIALDPGQCRSLDGLGVLLNEEGKFAEAEAMHRRAIAVEPEFATAHVNLGIALKMQKKYEEAEQEYRTAIALAPESTRGQCGLADLLLARGDVKGARAAFEALLAADGRNRGALLGLADVCTAEGKALEAAGMYQTVLENDPGDAVLWVKLGAALAAGQRPAEAANACARAIELKPDYAPAHNDLGVLLANAGKLEEAQGHFQRAVEVDQKLASAHGNLASVLAIQGKTKEAEEHFRAALELKPEDAGTRVNYARMLRDSKRGDETRIQIQMVLDRDPKNAGALELLKSLSAS